LTCWKLVSRASLCQRYSAVVETAEQWNQDTSNSAYLQVVRLLRRRHSPLSSWAGRAGLASPLRNARATLGSGATAPAAAVVEAAAEELPLRLGSALASSSRNCNHTRGAWKTTSWTHVSQELYNQLSFNAFCNFVQQQQRLRLEHNSVCEGQPERLRVSPHYRQIQQGGSGGKKMFTGNCGDATHVHLQKRSLLQRSVIAAHAGDNTQHQYETTREGENEKYW
jgi:hypothetical protein